MKRILTVLIALTLALTGASFAGDGHGHYKCTEEAQACLNKMVTKIKAKGWLGIETEKTDGGYYRVTAVVPYSPAAEAGFAAGDVLVALNGVKLSADNKEAMKSVKKSLGPGKAANYVVKREGAKQQLAVTLSHVPETVMAEWIGQHMIEQHATEVIASN